MALRNSSALGGLPRKRNGESDHSCRYWLGARRSTHPTAESLPAGLRPGSSSSRLVPSLLFAKAFLRAAVTAPRTQPPRLACPGSKLGSEITTFRVWHPPDQRSAKSLRPDRSSHVAGKESHHQSFVGGDKAKRQGLNTRLRSADIGLK